MGRSNMINQLDQAGSDSGYHLRDVQATALSLGGDAAGGVIYKAGRDQYIYQGATYDRLRYRDEASSLLRSYTRVFVGRDNEI
jgi:hypothetical protein